MRKAVGLLTLALLLTFPLLASGNGFWRSRSTVTYFYPAYTPIVHYYYPPLVYALPAAPACVPTVQPPPFGPFTPPNTQAPPLAPGYAPPTAAPPSGSQSSQTSLSSPSVARSSESQSYYDAYPVPARERSSASGNRAEVSFWNLTDRDLSLRVDGQTRLLPRGRNVPMTLPREFTWQLEGREPKPETLGRDDAALEIVIRR